MTDEFIGVAKLLQTGIIADGTDFCPDVVCICVLRILLKQRQVPRVVHEIHFLAGKNIEVLFQSVLKGVHAADVILMLPNYIQMIA